MLDQSNTTLPRKEMYSAFSVWTKDSVDFGGEAPKDGPNWSFFSDIRRLICDEVKLDPGFTAANATPVAKAGTSSSTASLTSAPSATTIATPTVAKMNVTNTVPGNAADMTGAGVALLGAAAAAAAALLLL
jgi:hypothetical protein